MQDNSTQAKLNIGFIGAGNMSSALINGLVENGYPAENILVADPNTDSTKKLTNTLGVKTASSNVALAGQAEVIILGIKPQFVVPVCKEIGAATKNAVLVSVAAGIPVANIANCFTEKQAIVRVMPNTPALIAQGASGLFANDFVSSSQRELVTQLFDSVGVSCWLKDESLMDLVTAISGSGPAYFFYLVECMIESAVTQGMEREQAETLINQTALGAAAMLGQSSKSAAELRQAVTSPGGTTAAALAHLKSESFDKLVDKMLRAAVNRGQELAKGE